MAGGFKWVMLSLAFWAALVALPIPHASYAYAQADQKPAGAPTESQLMMVDKDGNPIPCAEANDNNGIELGKGALLGIIMPCMVYTIESSTIRFTEQMVDVFRPLLYAFLTLVIVLFGVRVLQNEPQIYKQGFVLVLKLTFVLAVLNDLGNVRSISNVPGDGILIPSVYNIMNESQMIVTGAISTTSLTCPIDDYSNGQELKVWSIMDCVVGKLFGFTVGDEGKGSMLLASSMFGVLAGFMFGGSWGIVIFFGMLGVLVGVFMLVLRVATIFISSYLVICLMLIMSPLLAPLVFLKQTEQYFEKFWKNILGAFLAPIIVTSYVVIALLIYDKMLFAPDSMVQVLFDYSQISKAAETTRQVATNTVTGRPFERLPENATDADKKRMMQNPFYQNMVAPALSGANAFAANLPSFNIEKFDNEKFKKGKGTFESIFYELVSLFILAWLINTGLQQLSSIIPQLTSVRAATTGALGAVDGFENRLMGAGQQAAFSAKKAYETQSSRNASGEAFRERTPTAINSGLDAFMNAMKKKSTDADKK